MNAGDFYYALIKNEQLSNLNSEYNRKKITKIRQTTSSNLEKFWINELKAKFLFASWHRYNRLSARYDLFDEQKLKNLNKEIFDEISLKSISGRFLL
jgi:hypothetical protein